MPVLIKIIIQVIVSYYVFINFRDFYGRGVIVSQWRFLIPLFFLSLIYLRNLNLNFKKNIFLTVLFSIAYFFCFNIKYLFGFIFVFYGCMCYFIKFKKHKNLLFLFCLFLFLFPYVISFGAYGDEPEYLLNVHSFVNNFELDIRNDFFNEEHYKFGRYVNLPVWYARDKWYTPHSLSIAFIALLLPGYFVFEIYGAYLIILLLSFLTLYYMRKLLKEIYGEDDFLFYLFFALTFPFTVYSFKIYPEFTASFAALFFIYLNLKNKLSLKILILIFTALFLINLRFTLIICPMLIILFFKSKKKFALSVIIAAFSFLIYFLLTYGIKRHFINFGVEVNYFNFKKIHIGILGNLFDREFGLLFYNPFFVFFIYGAYLTYKKNKEFFLNLTIISSFYFIVICAYYAFWWGGQAPPARFIIPVMPLTALFLYPVMIKHKKNLWLKIILIYSFFIGLIFNAVSPLKYNIKINYTNEFLNRLPVNLNFLFPSVYRESGRDIILACFYLILLAALNFYLIKKYKREHDFQTGKIKL